MSRVLWLVSGAFISVVYGGLLWYSVRSVRAVWPRRTLMATWAGVLLRTTAVAALVLGLFVHDLAAGVWGLVGFLATRSLWCGWVMRRMASPSPLLSVSPPCSVSAESGPANQRERNEMG